MIKAAHGVEAGGIHGESEVWIQYATGALTDKINDGIGTQVKRLGTEAIQWGVYVS